MTLAGPSTIFAWFSFAPTKRSKSCRRPKASSRFRYAPQVERLEDRFAPAVIATVTTVKDAAAAAPGTSPVDTNGSGEVSLRSAIQYANTNNLTGTIDFLPGLSGTINLLSTLGNLSITDTGNLTIDASAAVITVSGANLTGIVNGGVFDISNQATDALVSLTITGGHVTGGSGSGTGGGIYHPLGALSLSNVTVINNTASSFGGGVYSTGGLNLTNCLIMGNTAGTGGGIAVAFSALTVDRTTVLGNSANQAGGLYIQDDPAVTITNSTVKNNTALDTSGIRLNSSLASSSLTIINTTVSGNAASGGSNSAFEFQAVSGQTSTAQLTNVTIANNTLAGAGVAGIWLQPGGGTNTVRLDNTIVASNTAAGVEADLLGTFVAASSNNLIGSGTGGNLTNGTNGNIVGVANPLLGALQNNGGPTQTQALLPGSPALGTGNTSVAPATDQRGYQRVVNGKVDIGAFENQSQSLTLTSPGNKTVDAGQTAAVPLGSFSDSSLTGNLWTVDVNWGDGSADTKYSTTQQGSLGSQSHAYAAQGSYTVSVTVSNADNNFNRLTFTATVNSTVALAPGTVPSGMAGASYAGTTFTASGGSGSGYTYTATGSLDGLTLSGTGVLSGTPTAAGNFNFSVTAQDSLGGTATRTYTLTVYPALSISPSSGLPTGTVGNLYSQQIGASGGSGGYNFSTTSTLPAGLSLSSAGLLSGTPTAAFSTATVTIQVTDSAGDTTTKNYSLAVNSALVVSPSTVPSGVAGTAYSGASFTATGGSGSGYTFAATGSLDGLTLSGAGALSGTPTAAGSFNFTVTATDGNGGTGSRTYTLFVKGTTSVSLAGSGSPSVYGQPVTLTATVTASPSPFGSPTGTVLFYDGGAYLGSGGVSAGAAQFIASGLALGGHNFTAVYAGDADFTASPTSNTVAQTVNPAATTVALVGSGSPSVYGQSVSFTATVSVTSPGAGTPTGTITLTSNGSPLATLNLASGVATFTTTALPGGSDSIVATYNGDANFAASPASSPLVQQVNPAGTTTVVTVTPNPVATGESVTFTAVVSALSPGSGTPGGSVTFLDGGTALGSGTLSGGVATFTTATLAAGSHAITAQYAGTADFAGSSSAGVTEVVNAPTPPPPPPSASLVAVGTDAGIPTAVNVYGAQTLDLKFSLQPFGAGFSGGARVAVADLNGDGTPDVIVGAGPGGGPQVRVYDGLTGLPFAGPLGSFYGILPGSFTGGVYVAAGDVNGDGKADVIVGAGAGGGPQVNVFSGKDGSLLGSFNAFAAGFTGGVRVAAGDVTGLGRVAVIAAAGPGGGPQVALFDGQSGSMLASFYAFSPGFTGGVYVAAGDVNGDGKADVIVGAGAGGGPQVEIFNGANRALLSSFFAFAPSFTGGVRVGALDRSGQGHAEILTSAGPGGGPQVTSFDSSTLNILGSFFAYSPQTSNGLFVSG